MGEQWILLWVLSFAGIFVIGVAVYDYLDRKKRGQEIKLWKYVLAVLVGLVLMWPILAGLAYSLPKLLQRYWQERGSALMGVWLIAAAIALAGVVLGCFLKKRLSRILAGGCAVVSAGLYLYLRLFVHHNGRGASLGVIVIWLFSAAAGLLLGALANRKRRDA